ncbi:molybdenum cofactor guanylyltransferase [Orbus hercynius]|uniref:Molybdenum cofactor guanylyltransferase n=1 Tax=Orbus hercynius TaxID=593135 RepID=A0A495RG52_9GAMM|nr:molybdenum cofactor guanylyltransferase MobA [Orbus hercynius]RKS85848.1 molybdenum cofactor guanylyltransferase [Orbus hercynius]
MLKTPITAIILAGGKSTRMQGNDKGLLLLKGLPLYRHVIDKINPQVTDIIINTNRHIEQYQQSGYRVICDELDGFLGPLAGIYSGLVRSTTPWNLVVSCDTPFLPDDLVLHLQQNIADRPAAYVFDGEKSHPTILLIHRNMAEKIRSYLMQGDRKLLLFLESINAAMVNLADQKQSFININTPEELSIWNQ